MAVPCGQGKTPRIGMTTWLVLAFVASVVVLAYVPANGAEPMSLTEAIRRCTEAHPKRPAGRRPLSKSRPLPAPALRSCLLYSTGWTTRT